MLRMMTRREFAGMLAASAYAACDPKTVIDTHVHLFDPVRFPYHANAVYQPPAERLDEYAAFVREAGISHAVIVHPEPYQDDHRYLEYCFAHEPSPGFFKGTCLLDPTDERTPARMAELVKRNPNRIVALRIHENRLKTEAATVSGAIRDRDLRHPAVRTVWKRAGDLGLAIQMHFIPWHAPEIARLAGEFREVPVVLDHLARGGEGTPAEYEGALKLAKLPRVYMKYTGVAAGWPAMVKRAYEAFGADRMIWGGVGMNTAAYRKSRASFDEMFAYASEADRVKIRGCTAAKLFRFG
jgi:predicted TIM-barrel fold metal-dependent hydrolase